MKDKNEKNISDFSEVEYAKKSNQKNIIILSLALSLVIAIGATATYFIMNKNGSESESLTQMGAMYPLDTFTVNVLSEDGNEHYLKVDMSLEMAEQDISPELEEKKDELRDIIIGIISSKSMEEVSLPDEKDKMKKEIIEQINLHLAQTKVKNVFFTNFVEQ